MYRLLLYGLQNILSYNIASPLLREYIILFILIYKHHIIYVYAYTSTVYYHVQFLNYYLLFTVLLLLAYYLYIPIHCAERHHYMAETETAVPHANTQLKMCARPILMVPM